MEYPWVDLWGNTSRLRGLGEMHNLSGPVRLRALDIHQFTQLKDRPEEQQAMAPKEAGTHVSRRIVMSPCAHYQCTTCPRPGCGTQLCEPPTPPTGTRHSSSAPPCTPSTGAP